MTEQQYLDWLEGKNGNANPIRVLLLEVSASVNGIETTRYFSDKGYVTSMAFQDVPVNTHYEPRITSGVTISEQLSLDGNASMAMGDIELLNADGLLDTYMKDAWSNRRFKIWHGDASHDRANFNLVMDGVIEDIDSRERNRINLKIRDKLERLNTPLSEEPIGGPSSNASELKPVTFGEVHNIEPALWSAGTLDYYVHTRNIERIIEVRDNGVPINAQPFLANGRIRLTQAPAGVITVSMQGDRDPAMRDAPEGYTNNTGALIYRIVTQFGSVFDRFVQADIDTANLNAFIAANPQPVGVHAPERQTVLDTITELAASVGAHVIMSRSGQLRLIKVALPTTPKWSAGVGNMVNQTLQLVERTQVAGAVKVGYCKNYTVQNGLLTGIVETHKALFGQEYLTKTSTDEPTREKYKQTTEPVMEPTLLLRGVDAQAEANRRLALRKDPHMIVRWTGYAEALAYQLGDGITVTHPRFDLAAGKNGMIVGLMPDYTGNSCVVEVLV